MYVCTHISICTYVLTIHPFTYQINGDLEFSMQRSVSEALDSIPNLDPILKLEWLKAELKQCQPCRKVGLVGLR